ncbi:hypothetical protein SAMN05444955_11030 [Lihuaxuella thermophila]|uniref:Uncharacterized protein n=1 Tax=Lihuaxuella thermophila TaxID=1173111 RepID=A0A1H8G296_9BACL|nr:hypothetical protein SAMN05444955_11030 [Lihuaxuella thermophila]
MIFFCTSGQTFPLPAGKADQSLHTLIRFRPSPFGPFVRPASKEFRPRVSPSNLFLWVVRAGSDRSEWQVFLYGNARDVPRQSLCRTRLFSSISLLLFPKLERVMPRSLFSKSPCRFVPWLLGFDAKPGGIRRSGSILLHLVNCKNPSLAVLALYDKQ